MFTDQVLLGLANFQSIVKLVQGCVETGALVFSGLKVIRYFVIIRAGRWLEAQLFDAFCFPSYGLQAAIKVSTTCFLSGGGCVMESALAMGSSSL